MVYNTDISYSEFLDRLSTELDIPPGKYQAAVDRYNAVGAWLAEGISPEDPERLRIYTQGSFRLGTVVRPIRQGKEADYDIDLVVQLPTSKELTSPDGVKSAVGHRLKENLHYRRKLEPEGARCWTLNYAEEDGVGFHLDALPCVLEDDDTIAHLMGYGISQDFASKAIAITHREITGDYIWSSSNPDGYADWFASVNRPVFVEVAQMQKQHLLESHQELFAKVDDVPDQLVKTPLQRVIQILKRHRDIRFVGHDLEPDKPISIIITTLAARLYEHEADTYSALKKIVARLDDHARLLEPGGVLDENVAGLALIRRRKDGTWVILNPVNPDENFADYWHENDDRKAKSFFQWVSWVHRDLVNVLGKGDIRSIADSMGQHLGQEVVNRASEDLRAQIAPSRDSGASHVVITAPSKAWGKHVE